MAVMITDNPCDTQLQAVINGNKEYDKTMKRQQPENTIQSNLDKANDIR